MTAIDTTDRASLIELDLPTAAAAAPAPSVRQRIRTVVAPPVAAPAPAPAPNPEVSTQARNLAAAEMAVAAQYGLHKGGVDDGGLFFEAGTKLWDVGDANLKAYQAEYQALPTLREAAATLAATIAAEERQDRLEPLAGFRLDIRGKLRVVEPVDDGLVFGRRAIAVSAQAISQIQGLYPHDRKLGRGKAGRDAAGGSKARAQWPSDRPLPAAPANINGWIGDLVTRDTKTQAVAPTSYRLRTRTHRGQREVFGVFSGSKRGYVPFDADKLLAQAADLQPDLRVTLSYDADTTRTKARCIAQAPIDIPAFTGVGRVHQIGFDLITADDGSSSLECRPFLIRVRCKNASLVQVQGKRTAFRHVGTYEGLRASMQTALVNASEGIAAMRDLWTRAAAEYFLDEETGAKLGVEEAFERLIAGEYIPTGGLPADEALDAYLAAWRAEDSPRSAMGIVMAMQRAAHETSWASKWAEDEIEASASQLLYQPVYQLARYEDEAEIEA